VKPRTFERFSSEYDRFALEQVHWATEKDPKFETVLKNVNWHPAKVFSLMGLPLLPGRIAIKPHWLRG
jgi:hypothetical protein